MNITRTTLSVGATAPFTAIHASDTHLTYADMRDSLCGTDPAVDGGVCGC